MPQIGQRSVRTGDFLKKEFAPEHFYCREYETVNTTTAGADKMINGAVVYQNDGTGDWLELADAFVESTDNIGIIVDDTIVSVTDGADASLAVLVRGQAIVAQEGINFGAATDSGAEAITALTNLGILVRRQV